MELIQNHARSTIYGKVYLHSGGYIAPEAAPSFDRALRLDGTNYAAYDLARSPSNSHIWAPGWQNRTSDVTMCGWVNVSGNDENTMNFFSLPTLTVTNADTDGTRYFTVWTGETPSANGGGFKNFLFHEQPNTQTGYNGWQFFCVTARGTTNFADIKAYQNGMELTSVSTAGAVYNSTNNTRIAVGTYGAQAGDALYGHVGRVAHVSVFDAVLDELQIAALYNGGTPPPSLLDGFLDANLVHHWRLLGDVRDNVVVDLPGEGTARYVRFYMLDAVPTYPQVHTDTTTITGNNSGVHGVAVRESDGSIISTHNLT